MTTFADGFMRARAATVMSAIAFLTLACDAVGPRNRDPLACPQTGEFGNYGCARFNAVLTTSSGAPGFRLVLGFVVLDSAVAGNIGGGFSDFSDGQGRVGLQWTWFVAPPARDTLRMRIIAIRPGNIGVPPQPLDSMEVSVVFARVGQRPPSDTVRWRLPE